jgi:hypothetical protein
VEQIPLTDTKFQLINTGNTYEQAGVLTTFGWLRRYEKNRTRANQLYERLLCRKFVSELPKVFPQDPGNLRETPGCNGCHATLDPLADFFQVWGEGGELYNAALSPISTTFAGHSGTNVSDLAEIIRGDSAFATCQVEHVWNWLVGRDFDASEAGIRAALTDYFTTTNFSFKELVYAVATHPTFSDGQRSSSIPTTPLSEPPLGEAPGENIEASCPTITYETDIAPKISLCTNCHTADNTRHLSPLVSQADWQAAGNTAVAIMASGQMPPGSNGVPRVGAAFELKEALRCWLKGTN